MPGFQRRASWLNTLFPASEAPTIQDPGDRSSDVSLVQPYDGGSYGYVTVNFLHIFPAQAAGNIDVLETGPEEICRVLNISANVVAGAQPRPFLLWLATVSPFSNGMFGLYGDIPVVSAPVLQGSPTLYRDHMPVLPPNCRIQFSYTNGDVLSEVVVTAIFIIAPVGSVFYL